MEVQLRKHDYEVITAHSVERALQLLSISPPDLIISEYTLDAGESAVTLCQRLKGEVATQAIPFLIITQRDDQRVECLNAGADEVLVKPIYIAELRDRAEILLQKRRRLTLEQGVGQRFFGRLEEMGLLDLMQVIEVSKRSGQLMIEHKSTRGSIWFQDGDVHDAELGDLKGKDALCRLLTWEYGQYEFDFKASPRPNSIQSSLGELRSRGLNYVDQWNKMCEQLPPLDVDGRVEALLGRDLLCARRFLSQPGELCLDACDQGLRRRLGRLRCPHVVPGGIVVVRASGRCTWPEDGSQKEGGHAGRA